MNKGRTKKSRVKNSDDASRVEGSAGTATPIDQIPGETRALIARSLIKAGERLKESASDTTLEPGSAEAQFTLRICDSYVIQRGSDGKPSLKPTITIEQMFAALLLKNADGNIDRIVGLIDSTMQLTRDFACASAESLERVQKLAKDELPKSAERAGCVENVPGKPRPGNVQCDPKIEILRLERA